MIGVVCDFYYPSIGGTQKLCQSVVDIFHEAGHDVEVITTNDSSRDLDSFEYSLVSFPNLNFSNNPHFLTRYYKSVFVFADLFSPSLHTIQTGAINHSTLVLNLDENVYKWIKNEENGFTKENVAVVVEKLKTFDTIVSFCKDAPVNKFLEESDIDYIFIPNFSRDVEKTETKDFDLHKTLGLDSGKKVIFNHGLFETRKNQLKLIESFHEAGLKDDYSLLFLGSPRSQGDVPYFQKCKKFVDDNGLQDNVKFVKGTNNTSLIDSLLLKSDVYVLPSTAEGLPLVLIEAMSAGLPWVSTPVGGVPSVMGDMQGGTVLGSINFSPGELAAAIASVSDKNSREDWENTFSKKIASKNYLARIAENSVETKTIGFANQVYNEPAAIGKYLQSCLQFSDIISEVYIINHRSSDNTLSVIESFKDAYDKSGVKLGWRTEERDFSKDYTIADLFGAAVDECSSDIVFRHDADFIFGEGYRKTMRDCIDSLNNDVVYACGYEIPVVSEKLDIQEGVIVDHGVCQMHVSVPRVFKKGKTKCLQNHVGGKYEWFHPVERGCSLWKQIPHHSESILSVNVKSKERQDTRETMNTFFEDLFAGSVEGNWLDNDSLRREKEEQNDSGSDLKKVSIVGEKYVQ